MATCLKGESPPTLLRFAKTGVIGIPLRTRGIEGRRIRRVQRGALLHADYQVRIREHRPTECHEVAALLDERALGGVTVEPAGQDEQAVECTTQAQLEIRR